MTASSGGPGEDEDAIPDLSDAVPIVEARSGRVRGAAFHRRLFETELHSLPVDQRVARAIGVIEPELSALCFDPVPRVIVRLFENPRFGLQHARLVATHHGNGAGLDALAARSGLIADRAVQDRLLRNTQSRVGLIRRLLTPRRLIEIWNVSESRDLGDRNRRLARDVLRERFGAGPPEEQVDLIVRSEGRALRALADRPLSAKAAQLLSKRAIHSQLLVRNLAQWKPTPGVVLAHLLRQAVTRGNPTLRAMVRRHPNCPSGL